MNGHANSSMGNDRIRYLIFINGRWRWRPTKDMRRAGFRLINLGSGTMVDGRRAPSAEDMTRALKLNEAWDRHRFGLPDADVEAHRFPIGSIGEAYLRVMSLRASERSANGIVWTSEQTSRDDWPRAWKWIEPLFADCDPRSIKPEQLIGDQARPDELGLRPLVAQKVSESEAHRVIKVWRALWVRRWWCLGFCELRAIHPYYSPTRRRSRDRMSGSRARPCAS